MFKTQDTWTNLKDAEDVAAKNKAQQDEQDRIAERAKKVTALKLKKKADLEKAKIAAKKKAEADKKKAILAKKKAAEKAKADAIKKKAADKKKAEAKKKAEGELGHQLARGVVVGPDG